jgi:hypothetical protein
VALFILPCVRAGGMSCDVVVWALANVGTSSISTLYADASKACNRRGATYWEVVID